MVNKKARNAKGAKGAAAFKQKGKKPPQIGGPPPDLHQGNMPPWMREGCPDEMWGPEGSMPPWMRERFPDEAWGPEGSMPPWMRGPGQDGMCERGGPIPPWRRGPFPGERFEPGGPMPPEMRGPFPDEMGERRGPMFPPMRAPFPHEMVGHMGPVPPPMQGPLPGEMVGHMRPVPPPMQGPLPGEMCDPVGNMAPQMRGPCSDATFEQRDNVPPQMRGPYPGEMCEPNRNVPPQMGRINSSGPLPGEDDLRRPGQSPAIKQKEVEKCAPVHQLASSKVGESTASAEKSYIQEGAERILKNFGLSHEDLEELSSYPEDQLKPENMPEILRKIRMRKMAQQIPLPGLPPSQETVGGDGLYSPSTGPRETTQPSIPFVGPSGSQPTVLPTSSDSWRINKHPTPSMMNDYYGMSPRVFPHICILCKTECKHSEVWLEHLNTFTHSESCHQLRQQYPDWNPEDASFKKRYESDRRGNQTQRQRSVSSSPERSWSSHSGLQSRSRSRSPGHCRGRQRSRSPISPRMSPPESRTSRQSAAQHIVTEQPHTQSEDRGKLSKDLVQQVQPKDEAASQEPKKTDLQQLALSSLVEKSVSQAMSMLQPGGTGSSSLTQGVGFPTLPSVQLDPASISLGLVSMMQMVATQVVQTVLASKDLSSGQTVANTTPSLSVASATTQPSSSASSDVEKQENKQDVVPRTISLHAGVTPQPSSSASSDDEEQENKQDVVPRTISPHADAELRDLWILGHSTVFWAEHHVLQSGRDKNLGIQEIQRVRWFGQRGMLWEALPPRVIELSATLAPPKVLLIHLGENDLVKSSCLHLFKQILKHMRYIKHHFPRTVLMWTKLLPRCAWEGARSDSSINGARRWLNRALVKKFKGLGIVMVEHNDIHLRMPQLFMPDGVHLSPQGYDVYLKSMTRQIEQALVGRKGMPS